MDNPNLNMIQRGWLDMVKYYDSEILYLPGKANVVADSLSSKMDSTATGGLCMRISMDSPFIGYD